MAPIGRDPMRVCIVAIEIGRGLGRASALDGASAGRIQVELAVHEWPELNSRIWGCCVVAKRSFASSAAADSLKMMMLVASLVGAADDGEGIGLGPRNQLRQREP